LLSSPSSGSRSLSFTLDVAATAALGFLTARFLGGAFLGGFSAVAGAVVC